MRRKFSDKYGYTEIRNKIQKEGIDERLRNRIWNTLLNEVLKKIKIEFGSIKYQIDYDIFSKLYDEVFGKKGMPPSHLETLINEINNRYSSFIYWYDFYNFLEDIVYVHYDEEIINSFKSKINEVLEQELSAYRFIDDCIAPIVDDVEIKEIEEVFKSKYDSVKGHLAKALEHLSDRESPDYQNSIKESITAVETIAKIITGKETDLASCLKQMNIDLNKQFVTGMNNIYGWTCKEDGIRHGHTGEELKTSFDEAKYMLVSCSAFINYLISKHES